MLCSWCPQGSVSDLRAQVVDRNVDRTDLFLDLSHSILDAVGLDRVHQEAGGGPALALDARHECLQALLVGAPAEHGVIALACEALSDIAADARTGTEDQTDWSHDEWSLSWRA